VCFLSALNEKDRLGYRAHSGKIKSKPEKLTKIGRVQCLFLLRSLTCLCQKEYRQETNSIKETEK
jgi:hypothetical protein